ncbi:DNA primase [Cronobacter phage Dev-CD-23823]|uniref:DNA primase n=1 Tax=Cronobacter phage Dev-CD-23823 TaxID=1712539 RepID=A0A0K8IXM7_9CAUD|nr:DNA primase [Cronobacter phage Dev-CD-23823]CUH74591.1 DNA primase [Cronobacter phage Dev-CD-23823]
MRDYIEERLWLPQARLLPVGCDDKIVHRGCGDRPSLFIKNDEDKFWCYCHRCQLGGYKEKTLQRVKQKLAPKTGWVPEDIIPLLQAVIEEPYNFRDIFARYGISRYVSLLRFARDTKRIYLPDESGSLMGLDATGQAIARFYSPHKRNLATSYGNGSGNVLVTGAIEDYLSRVSRNAPAILVMNRAAEKAALAELSAHPDLNVITGRFLKDRFQRDLKMFKE